MIPAHEVHIIPGQRTGPVQGEPQPILGQSQQVGKQMPPGEQVFMFAEPIRMDPAEIQQPEQIRLQLGVLVSLPNGLKQGLCLTRPVRVQFQQLVPALLHVPAKLLPGFPGFLNQTRIHPVKPVTKPLIQHMPPGQRGLKGIEPFVHPPQPRFVPAARLIGNIDMNVAFLSDPVERRAAQFHTTSIGAIVLTLAIAYFWQTPDLTGFAFLTLMGLLGTIGHFSLVTAFKYAPASLLSPFLYSQVFFSMLSSVLFFGDRLTFTTLAGTLLLVASGIYIWWRERKLGVAHTKPPAAH